MSSTEKSPRRRALTFGLGCLIAFALVGFWLYRRKHHPLAGELVAGAGGALLLAGIVAPPALLAVRAVWMKLAGAIGWVNSRILLGVFFFLVVTPIALIRRIRGREALTFKPGGGESYWRIRDEQYDPKHYEHPY
ncbi:MAG TPA: SxtJ family membrane protein [Polyangia bacterium]|nr:SxtJ family membrane protein [Polyangia bacterium]